MINPEHEAEKLIQEIGIEHPINPQNVCQILSSSDFTVEYHEKPLEQLDICGISIGDNNGAQILVNSNIVNPERRLFTAAHEIGHVVLHIQSGIKTDFNCTASELQFNDNNKLETEANKFAAALLLPEFLLQKDVRANNITWRFVQTIAKKYQTSLEATARRIISFTKDQCALIIHKDNQMWAPIPSCKFPCFIPKTSFPKNLTSLKLNEDYQLENTLEECDLSDWGLSLNKKYNQCLYSSVHDAINNRIMTLLAIEEIEPEEAEDEWEEPTF